MMNDRDQARQNWLENQLSTYESMVPLAADASFRCYFRVQAQGQRYVLMDAPPEQESCQAFVAISQAWQSLGLLVPAVHCADLNQGFLLLSDLGDQTLLPLLTQETATGYYAQAFEHLLVIQKCQSVAHHPLPLYDAALYQQEMSLFSDWYLARHLGQTLSTSQRADFDQVQARLIESALAQPQVCVHRDYHARNLMVLPGGELGILDFQDALWGPITYDLMSLLRDCYIAWPDAQWRVWAQAFQQRLLAEGLLQEDRPEVFLKWCDWMALQRHLKCIGIFSRLHYRDNKKNYMQDIPRVIAYARSICQRYPEFAFLETLL